MGKDINCNKCWNQIDCLDSLIKLKDGKCFYYMEREDD